jgi:asparagine synthetase B (glutamine-hydrolysing)
MPIGGLIEFGHPTPLQELRGDGATIAGADGTLIAASARLDNREELLRALDLEPDAADTAIVAGAFEKWRDAAPLHLLGDWAFAAWDSRARRLFLARDHYGMTTLYYFRDARKFAFATSRKPLFVHAPPALSRTGIEEYLADAPGEATFHKDIFRLPPAHQLTASSDSLRVTRYWELENVPKVRPRSDGECVERFLDLYRTAVRTRLRSTRPIATTLSAGLDSSSVTALAARELPSLRAYTSTQRFPEIARILPNVITDEWPLAHAAAEWCGNVDHQAVSASDITPLEAIDRSLQLHDEPVLLARHLPWSLSIVKRCRDDGVGVLLVAHMGNGAGSWSGVRRLLRWRARAIRMRTLLPRLHPFGSFWSEKGAGYGVEVRDPTTDVRLLEFCVGLPENQYARRPHSRWLMRRAVEGLVPPAVQWNTVPGRQGADIPLRLRADAQNVSEAIEEIAMCPAAIEFLNLPLMRARWESLRGELGPESFEQAGELTRSLLVGRFLARCF